jgi:hypothetical protein
VPDGDRRQKQLAKLTGISAHVELGFDALPRLCGSF